MSQTNQEYLGLLWDSIPSDQQVAILVSVMIILIAFVTYFGIVSILVGEEKNRELSFLKLEFPERVVDRGSSVATFTNLFTELHSLLRYDILTFELISQSGSVSFILTCSKDNAKSVTNKLNGIDNLRAVDIGTDSTDSLSKTLSGSGIVVDRMVSPFSFWHKLKPYKLNDLETLSSMVTYFVNSGESGAVTFSIRPVRKNAYIDSLIYKLNNKTRKQERINHNITNDVEMLQQKNQYPIYDANIFLVGQRETVRNLSSGFSHIAGKNELVRTTYNKSIKNIRFIPKEWFILSYFSNLWSSLLGSSFSKQGAYFNSRELATIIHSFKIPTVKTDLKATQIVE